MHASPTPVIGRFEGARALVTGAGQGIGEAAAIRLAAEGAFVWVNDLSAEKASSTLARILDTGGSGKVAPFDQSEEAEVVSAFEGMATEGGLDVLVANAGTAVQPQKLETVTKEVHEHLHQINVLGTFLVSRSAIPLLRKTPPGCMVVVSSTSGIVAHPDFAPYAGSKAAVLSYVRSLALELAPDGIRVNAVSPGGTATPLLSAVIGDEAVREATDVTPLGPFAQPEDIAATISFLASGDARHITGANVVVDGGNTLTRGV